MTPCTCTIVPQKVLDRFGRNSMDNAGMALVSSIHYSKKYNNTMWNSRQMICGDGDGQLFSTPMEPEDRLDRELATTAARRVALKAHYRPSSA